ncbi:hypothetical protein, partial [Candidatus Hakubella thermalkaliphila]|uniref:hypothetical protein n=1 Tax=Candidatus Hakubella thermalkaliphila TaxID=2754717 RepID=UPI001C612B82
PSSFSLPRSEELTTLGMTFQRSIGAEAQTLASGLPHRLQFRAWVMRIQSNSHLGFCGFSKRRINF